MRASGRRRHAVTELTVTVKRTPTGYVLTAAEAPGWVGHAADPVALARCLDKGFTEAEIAAYSRFRGVVPDLAVVEGVPLTPAVRRHPAEPEVPSQAADTRVGWGKGARRPDVHDPGAWTPQPDGRWKSPGGRCYPADTALVASVIARREAAGLPTTVAS